MITSLGNILAILLLDVLLSGDNVLVIGAAAAGLPRHQRTAAIIMGMVVALGSRIILVLALTTMLAQMPIISLLAGIILIWIAYKLMPSEDETTEGENANANTSFVKAVLVILIADITMSLDNVIAIAALANGNISSIIIGLAMSILLLIVGSSIISGMIARYRWLMYGAAIFVAWIANQQVWYGLQQIFPVIAAHGWLSWVIPGLLPTLMAALILRRLLK